MPKTTNVKAIKVRSNVRAGTGPSSASGSTRLNHNRSKAR